MPAFNLSIPTTTFQLASSGPNLFTPKGWSCPPLTLNVIGGVSPWTILQVNATLLDLATLNTSMSVEDALKSATIRHVRTETYDAEFNVTSSRDLPIGSLVTYVALDSAGAATRTAPIVVALNKHFCHDIGRYNLIWIGVPIIAVVGSTFVFTLVLCACMDMRQRQKYTRQAAAVDRYAAQGRALHVAGPQAASPFQAALATLYPPRPEMAYTV
ncbi:hypothetical protein RQP46_010079 [Phenoliferia psychrophenolica]